MECDCRDRHAALVSVDRIRGKADLFPDRFGQLPVALAEELPIHVIVGHSNLSPEYCRSEAHLFVLLPFRERYFLLARIPV